MAVGRQERFRALRPEVIAAFGEAQADVVFKLFELLELAWHDCYGEVSPEKAVLDDILACSRGDVQTLISVIHTAVIDRRDLHVWADKVRNGRSN